MNKMWPGIAPLPRLQNAIVSTATTLQAERAEPARIHLHFDKFRSRQILWVPMLILELSFRGRFAFPVADEAVQRPCHFPLLRCQVISFIVVQVAQSVRQMDEVFHPAFTTRSRGTDRR